MGSSFLKILIFSSLTISSLGSSIGLSIKGGISAPIYTCPTAPAPTPGGGWTRATSGTYPYNGNCNRFWGCDELGNAAEMECASCALGDPRCCGDKLCYFQYPAGPDQNTGYCNYCSTSVADCSACYVATRNSTI